MTANEMTHKRERGLSRSLFLHYCSTRFEQTILNISILNHGFVQALYESMELVPGASFDYLAAGDAIVDTQGSISLIQLMMRVVSGGEDK